MPTTIEKERELEQEIVPRIKRDLPGVDVLAVELVAPSRFCVYVDHPEGVDHALCSRVTDVLRDYLREYTVDGAEVLFGYGVDQMCPASAGKVLVPWPNRIRDGRYSFGGEVHQLALTEPAGQESR